MPTITQLKPSSAENFDALPETIKDWMASDQVTVYISEINKKLGLKGEKRRVIPQLVIRLVLKDLEPTNFISELSQALSMNPQAAKALTQEIEQKIFNPIAQGLRRDVGVDVKLIHLGKSGTGEEIPAPLIVEEEPGVPAPFSLQEKPEALPSPAIERGQKPLTVEPETEPLTTETPALIYKEGTFGRIPIANPPIKPKPVAPEIQSDIKPDLKLKVEKPIEPLLSIKPRISPPSPNTMSLNEQKPARQVSSFQPIPKATQIVHYNAFLASAQPRIVHYSNFRTPLNNSISGVVLVGHTVDLRQA